jgi:hypothetical protein
MAFRDFKKPFGTADRNILLEILQNNQVQNEPITAIHNIYKRNWIAVKAEQNIQNGNQFIKILVKVAVSSITVFIRVTLALT